MTTQKWDPNWYGSITKTGFYIKKMKWNEELYNEYQELCLCCCQLYIGEEDVGSALQTRIITKAIRHHILGKYFDEYVSPILNKEEDINGFYHTTIFRFNVLLDTSRRPRRAHGPLPPPDTDLNNVELQQLIISNAVDGPRSNTEFKRPEPTKSHHEDANDAMQDLTSEISEKCSLRGRTGGNDLNLRMYTEPTSIAPPPIWPLWNQAFLTVHVCDEAGRDHPSFRPRQVSFMRIRHKDSIVVGGEAQPIEPVYLDYERFRESCRTKALTVNIDLADYFCMALCATATDGEPGKYMEIEDEEDFDAAYRRFIMFCTAQGVDNTDWQILFVRSKASYDHVTSDAVSTLTPVPRVADPTNQGERRQALDATTSNDTTHTPKRPRQNDSVESENKRMRRSRVIDDDQVRIDRQIALEMDGDRLHSDLNDSDAGHRAPESQRQSKTGARSVIHAPKPPNANVEGGNTVNAATSSGGCRDADVKVAQLAGDVVPLLPSQDIARWAAKALSLDQASDTVTHNAGIDAIEYFESGTQGRSTEHLSIRSLSEFHAVFQLKDTEPVPNGTRFPIPGTNREAFLHQCLAVLFLESKDQSFCGGLLADQQGLGKTFETLFLIVRRRYRNMVWKDVEEDWRRTAQAKEKSRPYKPIHLPKDYDPTSETDRKRCPMSHRRPYQCPCEKLEEYQKKADPGWNLILAIPPATRDPWINEWKTWFKAADGVFKDHGFSDMEFLQPQDRPFKLVVAHESSKKGVDDRDDFDWGDVNHDLLAPCNSDPDGERDLVLSHDEETDHIVILTTYQSRNLLLQRIGTRLGSSNNYQWNYTWPRWIFIDEAHLNKNIDTAAPKFINELVVKMHQMRKEPAKGSKKSVRQDGARRYARLTPCSLFLLTGTPFAGNFAEEFGHVWLPIFEGLHTAMGKGSWDKDSEFFPCGESAVATIDTLYQQFSNPKPVKGTTVSAPSAAKRMKEYCKRTTRALQLFMIKRNNMTTLWAQTLVSLPPLKCNDVVCLMSNEQERMANRMASQKLISAWQSASDMFKKEKEKNRTFKVQRNKIYDQVSSTPGVPVTASFPLVEEAIRDWNGIAGNVRWNLTSHQIGEQNWHTQNFDKSPYYRHWKEVVLDSHKWSRLRSILQEQLNAKSEQQGGYKKVLIVTRAGANVLFLRPALEDLAAKLTKQWKRVRPIEVAAVVSQVPIDERQAIYELFNTGRTNNTKFQAKKAADILVVCSNCFGVGQNMGRATVMIVLEPQLSAQATLQLPARMRRVNGREACVAYTLVGDKCLADQLQNARNKNDTHLTERILNETVDAARANDKEIMPYGELLGPAGSDEEENEDDEILEISDDSDRSDTDCNEI